MHIHPSTRLYMHTSIFYGSNIIMNRKRSLDTLSNSADADDHDSDDDSVSDNSYNFYPTHTVKKAVVELEEEEEKGDSKISIFNMVGKGNVEELKKQIHKCDILNDRDAGGLSYLHRAIAYCSNAKIYKEREPMIKYLLKTAPQLTSEMDSDRATALCTACKNVYHHQLIKLLMSTNLETLNMPDKYGKTPLHYVTSFLGLKRKSLEFYPGRNDNISDTALELAQLFIDNGADIHAEDKKGKNVVHLTLKQNMFNLPVRFYNNADKAQFSYFVENMLSLLFKNGAKICSKNGNHALKYARNTEQAKLILDHDSSDLNTENKKGISPLRSVMISYIYEMEEHGNIIMYLLEEGATDKNIKECIDILRSKQTPINYDVIKKLLEMCPDYDINSKDNCGKTLLVIYGENIKNVEHLLSLGADASIVDRYGNSALQVATRNKDIAAMKRLLQAGANPFLCNQSRYNILVTICKQFANPKNNFNDWFNIFKIVINLLEDNNITYDINHLKKIIVKIFDDLFSYGKWILLDNNLPQILSFMMSNTNLNIKNMMIESQIGKDVFAADGMSFKMPVFDPIGYGIYRFMNCPGSSLYQLVKNFVNLLINAGFSPSDTPENCVTPLTVFLSTLKINVSREKSVEKSLFAKLFETCGNIESCILEIAISSERNITHLNNLKKQYWLPDALLIAFLHKKQNFVESLLPYWCGPPLALLIFNPTPSKVLFQFWLPVLIKYGGVPHGTKLFKELNKHIKCMAVSCPLDVQQQYQKYVGSPLSLQELCKYKVREMLAPKASQPGTNLPELMQEVMPYDLPVLFYPMTQ